MLRPRVDADLPELVAALHEVHLSSAYPSVWPSEPLGFLQPPNVPAIVSSVSPTVAAWVAQETRQGVPQLVGHVLLRRPTEPLPAWLQLVGRPAAELAVVSRLFVRPSARGQGWARRLLQVAQAHAQAQGWQAVLDVHERHQAAISLYESAGWQRLGSTVGDWREPDGRLPRVYVYLAPHMAPASMPAMP